MCSCTPHNQDARLTWQYAIRDRRLVELFHGVEPTEPGYSDVYAILGWGDVWHVLRDFRWVVRGCWADWRQSSVPGSSE